MNQEYVGNPIRLPQAALTGLMLVRMFYHRGNMYRDRGNLLQTFGNLEYTLFWFLYALCWFHTHSAGSILRPRPLPR
jgi:hypothetical protein